MRESITMNSNMNNDELCIQQIAACTTASIPFAISSAIPLDFLKRKKETKIQEAKECLQRIKEIDRKRWSAGALLQRGDHIRVKRGIYSHHGVYLTQEHVIHYNSPDGDGVMDWKKVKVIDTPIDRFLKGGELEVRFYNNEELQHIKPLSEIVKFATEQAKKGTGGYNLFKNNCEHFANLCTFGEAYSDQVEKVLKTAYLALQIPEKLIDIMLFTCIL